MFGIEGLTNPRGFIRSMRTSAIRSIRNIFGIGVCVAIPPVEPTPVPLGTPKTGYMIESMVTAPRRRTSAPSSTARSRSKRRPGTPSASPTGDTGAFFVALPQIPPRNVNWFSQGRVGASGQGRLREIFHASSGRARPKRSMKDRDGGDGHHEAENNCPMGISGRIASIFLTSRMTPLLAAGGVPARRLRRSGDASEEDRRSTSPWPMSSSRSPAPRSPMSNRWWRRRPSSAVAHFRHGPRLSVSLAWPSSPCGTRSASSSRRRWSALRHHPLAPRLGAAQPSASGEPIIKPKGYRRCADRLADILEQSRRAAPMNYNRWRAPSSEFKRVPAPRRVDHRRAGSPSRLLDADRMAAFASRRGNCRRPAERQHRQRTGALVAGNAEVLVEAGGGLETAADVRALVAVRGSGAARKPVFVGDVRASRKAPEAPTLRLARLWARQALTGHRARWPGRGPGRR